MFGKGKDQYTKLSDQQDIELTQQGTEKSTHNLKPLGYKLPSLKKPVVFNSKNNNITYTEENSNIATIKSERIAGFLREVRQQGAQGWAFDTLFQKMTERAKFEDYLQTSPTPLALIDYRLLRLGGHIRTLQGKGAASTNSDVVALSTLYNVLVEKLQEYELKIGELANKPSRHQNEQRKQLVAEFQRDWQSNIKSVADLYKNKKDTYNILLNVATVASTLGLALVWLFLKNLYRLSQRKGLGLFQFEQAHSRKVENLEKFYDDVNKATAADAVELQNYFTDDIEDAYKSCEQFAKLIGELQTLYDSLKTDETYTKKERKALKLTVNAFMGVLESFQQELLDFKAGKSHEPLSDIQKDFMEDWQAAVKNHDVGTNTTILTSKYPIDCTTKFAEIAQVSVQFGQELAKLQKQEHQSGRDSPSSHSSGSSLI